jgi:hypothetical protein
VSFIVRVCVVLCAVFRLSVVLFCVMCVICVLYLIIVPLPPGKCPFAVKINNNYITYNFKFSGFLGGEFSDDSLIGCGTL